MRIFGDPEAGSLRWRVVHQFHNKREYALEFFRWLLRALGIGIVGGLCGTLFDLAIHHATEIQTEHSFMLYLLPLGGILIVLIYRVMNLPFSTGTNRVIEAASEKAHVPYLLGPAIFLTTVITHLFGGSAGREGAALQVGGSIAESAGRILKLEGKDMRTVVMCGMSAMFSAMFGTPVTAAIFAMEVIRVGEMMYYAIVPCFVSSITAYLISTSLGIMPTRFAMVERYSLEPKIMIHTIILSILVAMLSVVFCTLLKKVHHFAERFFLNEFHRVIVGGVIVVALISIFGRDYTGAGMELIHRAIVGYAEPEAFLVKMLVTAVTIGFGYRGGEIVPTLFVGSTFGCAVGPYIGLDPGYAAAVSMTALFCGVTNAPVSAIILAAELFGSGDIILFALAISITFMLSGYTSLYSVQRYSMAKAFVGKHKH